MYRSRVLVIILGLLLAGGSGWGMYRVTADKTETKQVLIVSKKLEAMEPFTAASFQSISIPKNYVLPGAIADPREIQDKVALVPMYEGEQIIADKIGECRIVSRPGESYLFIPAKSVALEPGQKVDIYFNYEPGRSPYSGVEKILADKTVAVVRNEAGQNIHEGKVDGFNSLQAGIEILVTQDEIMNFLEKGQYAKCTIVRKGE